MNDLHVVESKSMLPSIVELVRASDSPDTLADVIAEWVVKPDPRKSQLVSEARELLAVYLLFLAQEPSYLDGAPHGLVSIIFEMPIREQVRLAMGNSKNPRIGQSNAILQAEGENWEIKRKLYPELTRFLRAWK